MKNHAHAKVVDKVSRTKRVALAVQFNVFRVTSVGFCTLRIWLKSMHEKYSRTHARLSGRRRVVQRVFHACGAIAPRVWEKLIAEKSVAESCENENVKNVLHECA